MRLKLKDNFHGANGTHLNAHTPLIGGPWVQINAGQQIQGNALIDTAGGGNCKAPLASNVAIAELLVDMQGSDGTNVVELAIGDVPTGENSIWLDILSNGTLRVIQYSQTVKQIDQSSYVNSQSGVNHLQFSVLPQTVRVVWNGATLIQSPRRFLADQVLDFITLMIDKEETNSPIVSLLTVLG